VFHHGASSQDKMQTLTTTHDTMLGGRLIDMELAKYLAVDFKGGDVFSKPKALIKLLGAAEKVRGYRPVVVVVWVGWCGGVGGVGGWVNDDVLTIIPVIRVHYLTYW
jgi:hypothetical protein